MKNLHRFLALAIAITVLFSTSAFANPDLVHSMLGLTFSAIDCDYDIDGNSSGYVIRFSSETYSYSYLMSLLFSNDETDKLMKESTALVVELCSDLRENIESLGGEKPNLTLILTDNTEKDYVFLIVCNDQIVYDILADR